MTVTCRLLLHTSCTTGFEAHVAGRPALSLVPLASWITESFISNHVNPTFATAEDFVSAAEKVLDGQPVVPDAAKAKAAERFVWNVGNNNGTQRIADLLLEGMPPAQAIALPALQGVQLDARLKQKFDVAIGDCREAFRRMSEAVGIKTHGHWKFNSRT